MVMQVLHKRAAGWLFKVIFIILVGSFAFWGIHDVFFGKPTVSAALAKVEGHDVMPSTVHAAFEAQIQQINQMGGQITQADGAKMGLVERTLDKLISDASQDAYAGKLGLNVGRQQLVDTIAGIPNFQDEKGRFDKARYQNTLAQNRMNAAEFESRLLSDLRRQPLIRAGSAVGIVPDSLLDRVMMASGETRVASVLTLPDSGITDVGQPDDKTINAAYEDGKDTVYQAPERRKLTIAVFDAEKSVVDGPDAATLKDLYEASQDELTLPERRSISFVTISDETKAKAVYEAVKAGKTFEDATAKATDSIIPPIRQAEQSIDKLDPAYADQVFAAEQNDVLPPIKTTFGYAVVKIDAVKAEGVMTLEQAHDRLVASWKSDRIFGLIDETRAAMNDAIGAQIKLEDAAKAHGFTIVTLDGVDRQGLDATGAPVAAAKGLEDAIKLGFETDEGRVSETTDMGEKGLFVVRVDAVIVAAPKPLDAVKSRIVEAWQTRERHSRNQTRAAALLAALNKGEKTLEQIAAETGATITDTPALTRESNPSISQPPEFLAGLFKGKQGTAFTATQSDGMMLAVIKTITPLDPKADADKRKEAREALLSDLGQDQTAELIEGIKTRVDVVRHDAAIKSFVDSYKPADSDQP